MLSEGTMSSSVSQSSRTSVKIAPGAIVCNESELRGRVRYPAEFIAIFFTSVSQKQYCGSVTFWCGSVKFSYVDPAISSFTFKRPTKKLVFLLITSWRYIYIIFQRWKVIKKSQNSRNEVLSYYFSWTIEGSGSVPLTNGSGSMGPKSIRIRNTAQNLSKMTNNVLLQLKKMLIKNVYVRFRPTVYFMKDFETWNFFILDVCGVLVFLSRSGETKSRAVFLLLFPFRGHNHRGQNCGPS